MDDFWTDILVAAISVFLPVFLTVLLALLRPVLKKWDAKISAELGQAEWETVKSLTWQFVMALEQRGLKNDLLKHGEAKKAEVVNLLNEALNRRGIKLDWDEIDAAIEEAVLDMKVHTNGTLEH